MGKAKAVNAYALLSETSEPKFQVQSEIDWNRLK